ncbi:MAG: hypothetical protein AAFY48_02125 [Bacteroidota bacterium]
MALNSGFINYTNSMASAMQEAFFDAWEDYMGEDQDPPEVNPQMQLMFVAVARGVVRHLTENPDAFEVLVNTNNSHTHTASISDINGS